MKIKIAVILVTITVSSFAASSIKVFSSPSTSEFNLGELNPNVALVEVYDHEGCLVMSSAVNKNNPVLEVLNLTSGSYQLVGLDVFAEEVQQGQMIVN